MQSGDLLFRDKFLSRRVCRDSEPHVDEIVSFDSR